MSGKAILKEYVEINPLYSNSTSKECMGIVHIQCCAIFEWWYQVMGKVANIWGWMITLFNDVYLFQTLEVKR